MTNLVNFQYQKSTVRYQKTKIKPIFFLSHFNKKKIIKNHWTQNQSSSFPGVGCNLWCHQFPIATSSRIEVCSIFVSHLAARFAPPVLAALNESGVPIDAHNSIVQTCAIHISHRIFGIVSQIVFDEAEAARCLLEFVQSHDDATDVAAPREQFVYLLFGGVEWHVAHVQCCG